MKIAWFTPFNIESAVGRYSKLAVEAIAQEADVTIFVWKGSVDGTGSGRMHQSTAQICSYATADVAERLGEYDLCVYNIGDYGYYHAMIYEISLRHPGIMILHDVCLLDLAIYYYVVYKNSKSTFMYRLKTYYGEETAKMIYQAALNFNQWEKLDKLKYGLSEIFCEKAHGVVVHSQYHKDFIDRNYSGPVTVLPLMYQPDHDIIREKKNHSDRIHVLTVGHVNPNKCIHEVIETIGRNESLRDKIRFTVVGSKSDNEYVRLLERGIRKYQLQDIVYLAGQVSDEELTDYYQQADLICNLRLPAMEGASASLVEQMYYGKGVIVINTGMYAEMPDECVFKISADSLQEDLPRLLVKLSFDRELVDKVGEKAKIYAENTFSEEKYKDKLLAFFDGVVFSQPMYEVLDQLQPTLVDMKDTIIRDSVVNVINELYMIS